MRDERLVKILIMEKSLRQNVLIDSKYVMGVLGFTDSSKLIALCSTAGLNIDEHYFSAPQVSERDNNGKNTGCAGKNKKSYLFTRNAFIKLI